MTPVARATALLMAAVVGAVAFVVAAAVADHLAAREPVPSHGVPRHLKLVRHRAARRHEWLLWTVGVVVRFYKHEDGGPKSAVTFASLLVAFSVLMGASQ